MTEFVLGPIGPSSAHDDGIAIRRYSYSTNANVIKKLIKREFWFRLRPPQRSTKQNSQPQITTTHSHLLCSLPATVVLRNRCGAHYTVTRTPRYAKLRGGHLASRSIYRRPHGASGAVSQTMR